MTPADSIPEALKKDPQAAKLLGDPAALQALLSSPETKRLMDLLNRQAGAGLRDAAKAAASGRPEALMGLLDQVAHSKEGAQAVEGIRKKTEQK